MMNRFRRRLNNGSWPLNQTTRHDPAAGCQAEAKKYPFGNDTVAADRCHWNRVRCAVADFDFDPELMPGWQRELALTIGAGFAFREGVAKTIKHPDHAIGDRFVVVCERELYPAVFHGERDLGFGSLSSIC